MLRGFNRGEHRRKRLVAVDERLHVVAGRQRPGDDAADHTGQQFQMLRAFMLRFTEVFRNRPADGFMHAEHKRATADAIDPEREIKQRTHRRHQPDEANPERCGAGIAFVQQGMG